MTPLLLLLALSTVPTAQPPPQIDRTVAANSFEEPAVAERSPKSAGGDPSHSAETPCPFWESLEDQPDLGECGAITAGLTNEMARSGNQALFIEAANLRAPYIGVQWTSRPIAVEGKKTYRITLWGRTAPALPHNPSCSAKAGSGATAPAPNACPQAPLYLNLQVSFYSGEGSGETGENRYLVLPLQSAAGSGIGLESGKWTPMGFVFETPEQARTLRVNFRCDGRAAKGAVNGLVYLDDFTLTEEPSPSGESTLAAHPGQKPCKAIRTNRRPARFICLPLAENQAK